MYLILVTYKKDEFICDQAIKPNFVLYYCSHDYVMLPIIIRYKWLVIKCQFIRCNY